MKRLALAVLGIMLMASVASFIGFASAATCPTINSVKVFVNNRDAGSPSAFLVSVGNHVDIQVCCKNLEPCPATLSLTWIDGKTYTRIINNGATNQCEMFYFQINSKITTAKCASIKLKSNCVSSCGVASASRCFKTR